MPRPPHIHAVPNPNDNQKEERRTRAKDIMYVAVLSSLAGAAALGGAQWLWRVIKNHVVPKNVTDKLTAAQQQPPQNPMMPPYPQAPMAWPQAMAPVVTTGQDFAMPDALTMQPSLRSDDRSGRRRRGSEDDPPAWFRKFVKHHDAQLEELSRRIEQDEDEDEEYDDED